MARLTLWFTKSETTNTVQLERTSFHSGAGTQEIMAIRGKTSGAYKNVGTFQWTPGVRALSLLLLNTKLCHLKGFSTDLPLLEGERHSLAASLDYALDKQPDWLFQMFGTDTTGNAYLRQLLLRSNPGRRRRGPVGLSINEKILPPESISTYVEGAFTQDEDELLSLIRSIAHTDPDANKELKRSADSLVPSKTTLPNDLHTREAFSTIVPVADQDIEDIFAYEEIVFPHSRATKEKLLEWVQHDPQNFMCIKDVNGKFIAYYILLFLKPEALDAYLSGVLLEDDIGAADLVDPDPANYLKQETAHICCFVSRQHVSMFTVHLLWHLIGRVLNLARNGSLSTLYTETTTADGIALATRFGFSRVCTDQPRADQLLTLRITPELLRRWEHKYKFRTRTPGKLRR